MPEKIRRLNDLYRVHGLGSGKTMITASVKGLGMSFQARAMLAVRTFTNFNADNNPHGENDFGSFELDGHTVFFKFDYFDKNLEYGSEDPADETKTCRVLTIMLAEDH